jgi:hypothetical protein
MASGIKDPQQFAPKKTNLDIYDVADFLFATKSLGRIAQGKGSWGDLVDVGVTAATFFVPPAKLLKLTGPTLDLVIKNAGKAIEHEATSVAAKRAAQKTLDDALAVKRQGYIPTGKEPVERVGKSVPFVPESKPLDTFGSELIPEVSPYSSKETAIRKYASKLEKQDKFKSTVEVKPAPKKPLTKEEQTIVEQVNKEIPEEIPKAEGQGQVPVINRKTGDLEFKNKTTEKTALPSKLSISPRVDRSAWLQNKLDKLTRKMNSLPKSERLDIQNDIDKYSTEFKFLRKKLTEEERVQAGQLYEELNKLDLKKASQTSVKKSKFNLEESKNELARLREEWSKN